MKDMCRCIDSTIECSGVDSSMSLGVHVSLLFVYKFIYEFAHVLVGDLQYRVPCVLCTCRHCGYCQETTKYYCIGFLYFTCLGFVGKPMCFQVLF